MASKVEHTPQENLSKALKQIQEEADRILGNKKGVEKIEVGAVITVSMTMDEEIWSRDNATYQEEAKLIDRFPEFNFDFYSGSRH